VVQSEGGFEAVTQNSDWSKVVSKLGYRKETIIGPILWENYEKILYPYDIFISGATTGSKVLSVFLNKYFILNIDLLFIYVMFGNESVIYYI